MSPTIDLGAYQRAQFALLQARLGEISQFLVSLHLATANYDPKDVKDESCLLHLGSHAPSMDGLDELYRLAEGTEEFAVRMGILAMCTTAEECIINLLLPFCTTQEVVTVDGQILAQDWVQQWSVQRQKLLDLTFGGLIARVECASEILNESDLPHQWPTVKGRLRAFNKLRNCIAHRLGLVSNKDIDRATGTLSVSWVGLEMHVDETRILGAPRDVGAGSRVGMGWRDQERHWALGTRVLLTPDEAQQIAIYLVVLLQDVGKVLMKATAAQCKDDPNRSPELP